MKILIKQIDEFRSSLTNKVFHEYLIYMIDDNGDRLKAQTCIGENEKKNIVANYITDIVMNDKITGVETPITFENVSFEEYKNLMN